MGKEPLPEPIVDDTNRFFWEGVARSQLLFQRCSECAVVRYPPGLACHACHSIEWEVFESSGQGHIYSYSIPRRPQMPFFEPDTVLVLVELEHGVRILSHMVGEDLKKIDFNTSVEVVYTWVSEKVCLPQFRVSEASGTSKTSEVAG